MACSQCQQHGDMCDTCWQRFERETTKMNLLDVGYLALTICMAIGIYYCLMQFIMLLFI